MSDIIITEEAEPSSPGAGKSVIYVNSTTHLIESKASSGTVSTYGSVSGVVSDTAYGGSWDGVTSVAPSKNAVYDKVEAVLAATVPNSRTVNGSALSADVTLTTAVISDSSNKRYVTDANLTTIGNQSGTNTGDETTATIKTKLSITTLSGSNTGDQTSVTGNAGTVTNGVYTTDKDATGGVPGLTLFKINFMNAANTFKNFFTNATTAARTYTFPDKDITVAGLVDITGTNSGTNTGDQTITLTSEVTGSGTGSFATTVSNAAVIGKVLTGYTSGAGTVASSDSILGAIQKLNGNIGAISAPNLTGAVTSVGAATSLGSFSSANLSGALTDETGSGSAVFATSPTLVTPALGTPSALVGTNITGTATAFTSSNVTTNANLTGHITSTGNAAALGSFTSAQLATALTDETGSGANVFATSPTLVTPILGTPTSGTLTNATGLPISTGVSGLGTGVAAFLATPSSANLITAVTDETGTGSLVFATSPTLVTPALGTPSALVGTNITGTATSFTASNVTTNANLTGHITSTGNAAVLGSFTSAQLATALTDETGSGANVFGTTPTFTTNLTSPLVIGGAAAGSSLTLKTTSATGNSSAVFKVLVGTNGGTNAFQIENSGIMGFGATNGSGNKFDFNTSDDNNFTMTVSNSAASGGAATGISLNNNNQRTTEFFTGSTGHSTVLWRNATVLANNFNDLIFQAYAATGNIRFHTAGQTSTNERMIINSAGNVGIGITSPNANAILDVTSTTKAFMVPRMTTTQKNAIASPTEGMEVYDLTLHKKSIYTGSAWETVTSI